MSENQSLLYRLEELLTQKKSKKFYAEKLGISEYEVNELLKELREKDNDDEVHTKNYTEERKVNVEKGTIESTIVSDFDPKDDIELAKLHKINLDKYIITNYWSKMLPSGKFTSSVFSKKKQAKDYSPEDFAKFLENYKPSEITIKQINSSDHKEDVDLEISIADFHLAKKTLEGETIQDKKQQFMYVLLELLNKATASFNIKTVVFPISNDFFHTDNYQNQTTNGTPQDVLTWYDNEYEEGFDLLVTAISVLNAHADNVEVVLVQGNHDRTKSFYLAHALDVYFSNKLNITFQREHSTTKVVLLGNTFIGYHHGNCKIEDLPLLFATGKNSEAFGCSKYREVHTGDKHHYMAKEVKGVRIQQMPSLSGVDRWHLDNNYVHNIRAGIATAYHPVKGRIAEFESRI
jgi:hypothetical protein